MPERRAQSASAARGRTGTRRSPGRRPRTNAEWSAQTIEGLTLLARREFARHGYEGASVERIAEQAGLTKGAVYYHFRSKEGLFEVVLRDIQRQLVERIEERAGEHADPLKAVQAGCEVFLEVATDDEFRRIAITDGPAVLGWSAWRTIDGEYGLGSLKRGLHACRAAGVFASAKTDVEMLAHLLSGALNEAVFLVAESADPAQALRAAKRSFADMLLGLCHPAGTRLAR
jgi:AcrR family transcriptional regulator